MNKAFKSKNCYAVILAGGCGKRFWPKSSKTKPKQFLDFEGGSSLFQRTIKRISPPIKPENIFIVTGIRYKKVVLNQIKGFKIPVCNILLEPSGKNTAPAICWAAKRIKDQNPNGAMMVLPADHLIKNKKQFLRLVKEAFHLSAEGFLVTMGITPTRPETGYGYLKVSPKRKGRLTFLKVERFIEKPDIKRATKYLKAKNYLWNSGMFFWRCDVVLDEYKRHLPRVYQILNKKGLAKDFARRWQKLPGISVDYGILEKSQLVVSVSAKNIGWSDVGSWQSLADVLKKDRQGNHFKGNTLLINCQDSLILAERKLIAGLGLKDIVIVDTKDCLLVCAKKDSQLVKKVYDQLESA